MAINIVQAPNEFVITNENFKKMVNEVQQYKFETYMIADDKIPEFLKDTFKVSQELRLESEKNEK